MLNQGNGLLITMMNVDATEELDFNDWYDKEHIAERVEIEGFTQAARYLAVDAKRKYLNLYATQSIDVLESPQYQKALQNQTQRSMHHIERFRDSGRAIANITVSHGAGQGAALFFAAIRPAQYPTEHLRSDLNTALERVVGQYEIIASSVLESDPRLSKPLTEDEPPPSASDWYVVIEGTSSHAASEQGSALIANLDGVVQDSVVWSGVYRLMWSLSKADVKAV